MTFRVTHHYYLPTYFRTKKEALAYIESRENKEEYRLEKKMAYQWYPWG